MLRVSMRRHCAVKLPGYRSAVTRFGEAVGASRLSPLSRLAVAGRGDARCCAPSMPLRRASGF